MLVKQLKSKIHRVRLAKVDLEYEGSISIDKDLMAAAKLEPFESVHIWNVNNGMRLETYVIEAPAGSGEIGLNGAAARGAAVGDVVIIASWVWRSEEEKFAPAVVFVDAKNRIKKT
ncbi:MAG: aspartate 1-decarboxylase [Alphaproteobacteria bacterium]|nr:aspartate 1-decarboxylase [Alphaproteobacteria bacterium]